jgi:hypothetical protein
VALDAHCIQWNVALLQTAQQFEDKLAPCRVFFVVVFNCIVVLRQAGMGIGGSRRPECQVDVVRPDLFVPE